MYILTSRPSLFPPFNVVGGAAGLAEKKFISSMTPLNLSTK